MLRNQNQIVAPVVSPLAPVDSPAKCQICQQLPLYSERQKRVQVATVVLCLPGTRRGLTHERSVIDVPHEGLQHLYLILTYI